MTANEEGSLFDMSMPTVWLLAVFQPVSFFSLRTTYATSKGGKTLLVPTPYAVKMALLDACFRYFDTISEARQCAKEVFDLIKDKDIRFRPPKHCLVQNTFIKALEPSRREKEKQGRGEEEEEGEENTFIKAPESSRSEEDEEAASAASLKPFKSTVIYREFAYFEGELTIAIDITEWNGAGISLIQKLLPCINSLGKRGSFWQYISSTKHEGPLPPGFTCPHSRIDVTNGSYLSMLMTLPLDDFGERLCQDKEGFERVDTYSAKEIKLNEHRVLQLTGIPYRRIVAGRHFTWYQRDDSPTEGDINMETGRAKS